jgi:predicted DNA-binding transcriptional regulator AlpA
MDDRLITIDQFTDMIGFGRQWYYKHQNDEDLPRRVYVGGRPKLSAEECRVYIERLKRLRPPRPGKRRVGRPRKDQTTPPSAAA